MRRLRRRAIEPVVQHLLGGLRAVGARRDLDGLERHLLVFSRPRRISIDSPICRCVPALGCEAHQLLGLKPGQEAAVEIERDGVLLVGGIEDESISRSFCSCITAQAVRSWLRGT